MDPSDPHPKFTARDLASRALRPAEKVYAALVDPARQDRAVLGLLACYVVIWTLFGVVSKGTQEIRPDTGELLTWSNELALGYWKHPPLGVYIVKLWTTIFPVEDWSLYLLGMIHAAVALWIAWSPSRSADLSSRQICSGCIKITSRP
jgi:hypothetical protein